jgi:hypothetical protein
MRVCIAPVSDQIASTAPPIAIAIPELALLSITRVRVSSTRVSASRGMMPPSLSVIVSIASGLANKLNAPTAASSRDGIARNE